MQASFIWPSGATSVEITVIDGNDTVIYNETKSNSTTAHLIPMELFKDLASTSYVNIIGMNPTGPATNRTSAMIVFPIGTVKNVVVLVYLKILFAQIHLIL